MRKKKRGNPFVYHVVRSRLDWFSEIVWCGCSKRSAVAAWVKFTLLEKEGALVKVTRRRMHSDEPHREFEFETGEGEKT